MKFFFKRIFLRLGFIIRKTPALAKIIEPIGKFVFSKIYDTFPSMLNNEIKAVKKVLISPEWNMGYGKNLVHHRLEDEFAKYIGTNYAVVVNTGGMAIQMVLRAIGIKPGDEIVHQVDTCVATSFAIINAGGTPVFSDISLESLMLSKNSLVSCLSNNTKVVMPVHIWGNPENLSMVNKVAEKYNLLVIEDACLSFGAEWENRKVGSIGKAGVFSFGSTKPIQAGEGGMITTNDESLAKELRTIRSWGETTIEYGQRDQKTLSWNGRASEIVAAVMIEQLRGYPKHLERILSNVNTFKKYISNIDGIEINDSSIKHGKSVYSQVVTIIDETLMGISKENFFNSLKIEGIAVWHANFEPIPSLSFFKNNGWKEWYFGKDILRINNNYNSEYPNSNLVYTKIGLGFLKSNFISSENTNYLIKTIDRILTT